MTELLTRAITESYDTIMVPLNKELLPPPIGKRPDVMDDETRKLIEIDSLFNRMNHTRTKIGAKTLRRSLEHPLTSAPLIKAKQDAVRELASNPDLREKLKSVLEEAATHEDALNNFYEDEYRIGGLLSKISQFSEEPDQYNVYKGAGNFLKALAEGSESIKAESPYTQSLCRLIGNFKASDTYNLIVENPRKTLKGVQAKKNIGRFTPSLEFKPTDYKPLRYLPSILIFLAGLLPDDPMAKQLGIAMTSTFGALAAFMGVEMGRLFDYQTFVNPLRKMFFNDNTLLQAVESLGELDELLSVVEFAEASKTPMVFPKVVESDHHTFTAKNLKNPMLAILDPDFVGNDITLDGSKLTVLTGPNSGGKTTTCKTISQTQLLAQIGAPVCAESVRLSVADKILYLAPMVNSLEDKRGRLGTEAERLKNILFQTTPKSLVILDELIEATDYKAKKRISWRVLKGFDRIGNSTLLVTHFYELAQELHAACYGQFLQVEFDGKKPTHKLIPGISTDSHADEVLDEVGLSQEAIDRYITEVLGLK